MTPEPSAAREHCSSCGAELPPGYQRCLACVSRDLPDLALSLSDLVRELPQWTDEALAAALAQPTALFPSDAHRIALSDEQRRRISQEQLRRSRAEEIKEESARLATSTSEHVPRSSAVAASSSSKRKSGLLSEIVEGGIGCIALVLAITTFPLSLIWVPLVLIAWKYLGEKR